MTTAPDDIPPRSASDSADAPPTASTRRHFDLLGKAWFLNLLLLALMIFMVGRNLVNANALHARTETRADLDDSVTLQNEVHALALTKSSYSPGLALSFEAKAHASHSTFTRVDPMDEITSDRAVSAWRKLTSTDVAQAAEWRRFGITLALLHRKGAMDALLHVRAPQRSDHSDPFGHGPTGVPVDREIACWRSIYGAAPLPIAQAPSLRHTLARLRLGWFENVAAAQLYARAGLSAQAREAAEAANRSARPVDALQYLDLWTILMGIIGLLILIPVCLALAIYRQSVALPGPAPGMLPTAQGDCPAPATPPAARLFPYAPLILTFITYLACHVVLGPLVSLALKPFHSLLAGLTLEGRLRLELSLQLSLSVPVLLVPLLVLRRKIVFDPLTGRRIMFRGLLQRVGFRTRNPFAEVGSGALGYILTLPVVTLATLLSFRLFAHFSTPNNPAELWALAAQLPADRLLVILAASVGAPLVEETMFRGILYPALRGRLGIFGGAALSAAIFSGLHPTLPAGFLPIWALGVSLALIYEWRGSLLPGMVLHGIFNGAIVATSMAIFAR